MCGILGFTSAQVVAPVVAENSLRCISHRGPDYSEVYSGDENRVHLGHARLSIIDTSNAGNQPMVDFSGRYVMVYNGEVYNFQELKTEIEVKYGSLHWRSNSDSEVIIEGFAREGVVFLERLNGIFSLIIFDKKSSEFHVLRDPIGIKPLYMTRQSNGVYFCSELKGLLDIPGLKKSLRRQSLSDQLAFMYVPEPFTMFEEFVKVPPGHHMVFKHGVLLSEKKLFGLLTMAMEVPEKPEEAIDKFGELFSNAVKRQLVSDVPVSLFLSGGLDSSAVAYETMMHSANIHSAYTISFNEEDRQFDDQSSDLYYASRISKELGIDLQVIEAESNFMDMLPDLVRFMEDGVSDPAAINTYLISKSARESGIKVMLSGQGADEYLCGYRRYLAESHLQSMNPLLKGAIGNLGRMLPGSVPGRFNAPVRRIKRLSRAAMADKTDRLSSYFTWSDASSIKSLFVQQDDISPGIDLYNFFENQKSDTSTLDLLLMADQKFDLLSLNLSYSDRMSMATGVELRVPFLDFELVRYMNSLPMDLKLKGNTQKYILKKSMEGKLPHEIIYRSKAGFALPIRSWLRKSSENLRYYFDVDRLKSQEVFDPTAINLLLQEQLSGKQDHSYLLFSLLCQQIWIDKIS